MRKTLTGKSMKLNSGNSEEVRGGVFKPKNTFCGKGIDIL